MALDFDWRTGSAPRYVKAYRRAIAVRDGLEPAPATEDDEVVPLT